jgi:hypothetical protein
MHLSCLNILLTPVAPTGREEEGGRERRREGEEKGGRGEGRERGREGGRGEEKGGRNSSSRDAWVTVNG